jgi:hypothetical protein
MKKIIVYGALALGSIFLAVSCQKTKINPENASENSASYDFRKDNSFIETFGSNEEQVNVSSNQRLNISELMEIAKIEDEEARRTAYSLLNLPERLDYWDYLISYKVDNGKYSENQKQLLIDIKEVVVKPNMFANKNLQEIFRTQYLPLIAGQLKNAGITGDDVDKIFISGSISDMRTLPGSPTKRTCVCNTTSMFGCSSCKSTECKETGSGCGFVMWFSCDGECGNLMPQPIN